MTTPHLPDEIKRLLDNGWMVVLRKSALGDYCAMAIGCNSDDDLRTARVLDRAFKTVPESQITNHFTPSQALTTLPEKVFGCRG